MSKNIACVYLLRGTGPVPDEEWRILKIGVTTSIEKRLYAIRRHYDELSISLVDSFSADREEAFKMERAFHKYEHFVRGRHRIQRSEWYPEERYIYSAFESMKRWFLNA